MNIKIHTSLVLGACTAAAIALGGFLMDRYRDVDAALADSGKTSVSLRNVQLMSDSIGQWLTVSDLVFLEHETTLIKTSTIQAARLRQVIKDVAASPLATAQEERVAALVRAVDELDNSVKQVGDFTGEGRIEQIAVVAQRARPLSDLVISRCGDLQKALELRASHLQTDLEEQRQVLVVLSWLAGIVYFAVVWLCWLWTVHKVVLPIGSLSEAAARADHEERDFVLPETGPEEVRQLTHNISNFVTKLQDAKASTEAEVRQRTQELVKANKAKGEFLATMSHELRTPLNGIINMNELLLETDLDNDQSDFLRTAKSAAEALLALINDILDFSKIEARKLELEQVEFDIRAVVDSAVEILAGVAESKGLVLQAVIESEVPWRVIGDPTRLRQVVINLLNNALKFTKDGSVVVRVAVVADTGDQTKLRLEVVDTGIGIPEDRKASLFRAFEQVDSSTTREYGGTGLGLAICRELVTLMGGEIDVDSAPGEGSTFWFAADFGKVTGPEPEPPVDIGDTRVALISRRPLTASRIVHQLRFLGVRRENLVVVGCFSDLDPGASQWLALVDPYDRDGDAFADVDASRAHDAVDDSRIAVLDNWMRHWNAEMGAPRGDVVRMTDPTTLTALRAWLLGSVAVETCEAAARGHVSTPKSPLVAAVVEQDQEDSDPVEAPVSPKLRVLVAEDIEINQRVMRSTLERSGFEVVVVENGLHAVERMATEDFDLVLMDCQMPVMDGLEATRRIRAMEMERTASSAMPVHVPIIAITANAHTNFDKECLAAGMDRFLSKPCRKHTLIDAIYDCLDGRRSADKLEIPSPRILVADDDAINRKVVKSVLSRAGYRVVTVENGQEAVDKLATQSFDIVLMDCQMPVMDGLAACRLIRDLECTVGLAPGMPRRVPIVALTGNVQDSDRELAAEAGMDDFLTKPFRPKSLLAVVLRFVGPARNRVGAAPVASQR